jgi:vancomycin resistance protein YoaR
LAGRPLDGKPPTAVSQWTFGVKMWAFRIARALRDNVDGPQKHAKATTDFAIVAAESRSALWSDTHPAEHRMQLGKVQNLALAAWAFDGVVLPAGEVFSFWKQLGRVTRRDGYAEGRMLQEGCLIPAVGGGLCQLSNALYDAALKANCQIVERHAHSRRVPGSAAAFDRDATVAWNYVDLRFRSTVALQLRVRLVKSDLVVQFLTADPVVGASATSEICKAGQDARAVAHSCADCRQKSCRRYEGL